MSHLDTVFTALAHPLRREVLSVLSGRDDGVAEIEELAERLEGVSEAESTARLRAALHHTHLPTLDEAGLAEYDPRSGAVRYRESPMKELVESAVRSSRDPRSRKSRSSTDS
ncbi:DUF7344 domain-containing protein [Halorussus salinus]|uniref:DUF7344 domain-containing protein n=1 Tax=Halorussus salinus TaxID=1364935 RepID=UPI0010924EE1|nr:helix-turn-helix domain-containing protein [Halorussus salinus]